MVSSESQILKSFCNWCSTETNHSIKAEYNHSDIVDYEVDGRVIKDELGITTFQVVQCAGCESTSFRKEQISFRPTWDAIMLTGDSFSAPLPPPVVNFYPERLQGWLIEKPTAGFPTNMRSAYREVLDCYNYNLLLMCASGLRSLVEGLCVHFNTASQDSSGRSISLGSRVRELATKRLIPNSLADALRAHKELGNDALHNLIAPDKEEFQLAIELIETAFENLFTIAKRHSDLGGKMTRRMLP